MNPYCPKTIDGATVILHADVSRLGRLFDVDIRGFVAHVAVARYSGVSSVYLFYCSSNFEVLSDTYHDSLDDAVEEAAYYFPEVHFLRTPSSSGGESEGK